MKYLFASFLSRITVFGYFKYHFYCSCILGFLQTGQLKHRELEAKLDPDFARAVRLRRHHFGSISNLAVLDLPYENYDYSSVSFLAR